MDATPAMTPEMAEASVRKLEAECREIEARIKREDALAASESDKNVAEASHARAQARLTLITVRDHEREAREAACDFKYSHRYSFSESTTAAGTARCIAQLNVWDKLAPKCDIEIVFNSPGGEVIPGMVLFDFIRRISDKGHHITTVATGMAASMAGILLQAGDIRVATPESMILIHEIAFSAGGKIGEVEDTWEMARLLTDHVVQIFVDRSGGKLSEEFLRSHWLRKDWWLDAKTALALGIVDEVR